MQIPLTVTESAKTYLQEMLIQHKKQYVRLAVQGGGCSGFKYDWDFTDEPEGKVIDGILELDPMSEMFVFGCLVIVSIFLSCLVYCLSASLIFHYLFAFLVIKKIEI